ncbi:MAG TPA: DUF3040 domain-containing protein [Streptosporangiaceae bacterium]
MPLSEHEQRQLEQIEQALYADYPKLAQSVRAQDPRVHYKRRVVEAAIGFLLGVGFLLAGVISKIIFIGVGGFVIMLACAMWALTSWRHMGGIVSGHGASVGRGPGGPRGGLRSGRGPGGAGGLSGRGSGGGAHAPGARRGTGRNRRGRDRSRAFMERLEERWRRRQEGGR